MTNTSTQVHVAGWRVGDPITPTRIWRNPDNRRLSEIQEQDGRFGIGPMTINSLDRMGLNHLEIISLCDIIGKSPIQYTTADGCLLYTSPSPRDATLSRMPSSA